MMSFFALLTLFVCLTCLALKPTALSIARMGEPTGLDDPTPALRWSISAEGKDVRQSACAIRIASQPENLQAADVWESGPVKTTAMEMSIPASVRLLSGGGYCWQVRVWDQHGQMSDWSGAHGFSMGLREDDWTADWITPMPPESAEPSDAPADGNLLHPTWWMRRTVILDAVPDRVALSVVSLGYYTLYVNGQRVSDEPLAPSVTKLDARALSVTHEISALLRSGENCIALACSSGWYLPHQFAVHEDNTPLIRLQAVTRSGEQLTTLFGSDGQWLACAANRSIIGGWKWDDFGGEAVNGQSDSSLWKEAHCDTDDWHAARVVPAPPVTVSARTCPPNRVGAVYRAEAVREVGTGVYEVDFGRCLAGQVRLRFPRAPRGRSLIMRFFDIPSDEERTRDHSYKQMSTYLTRGDGTDCFENVFNYAGFRYVTIQGLDASPALADMEAMLVETALERVGSFRCSNELFNRIHDLNAHTLRCLDLGGYHVDCPHRERNGYGADGQTALPVYPYLFDAEAFLHKWLVDWQDVTDLATGRIPHTAPIHHAGESPAWGGIVGPLAWRLYLYYGDRHALELAFPLVQANLKRLQTSVREGVLRADLVGSQFHGDWVAAGRGMNSKNRPTVRMKELFNTACLVYLWQTFADIGRVLGKTDAVAEAEAAITSLQQSFHKNFFDEASGYYLLPEQAYQAMPLWVGAVPEAMRDEMHARLIDLIETKCEGHVDTGLPATTFLLDYLEHTGCHETIYTIMNQETYPSWGYMLAQGATAIWEQWDGFWSQIHSCFAGPASWFYSGLAGIRPIPEHPGFAVFELKPAFVEGLDSVEATYRSVRGPIRSAWRRGGNAIDWDITIPPNTSARVSVPVSASTAIRLDGQPLSMETTSMREDGGKLTQCFSLPSGNWRVALSRDAAQ